MKKIDYYKGSDLFIENMKDKVAKEYFNEFGYNFSASRKNEGMHIDTFSKTSTKLPVKKKK